MAKRHIIGNLPSGDILCRCDDGNTYENCGTNCDCCNQFENVRELSGWSNRVVNPASKGGFGFNKSYDGKIRGGIITPEFYTSPRPIANTTFGKPLGLMPKNDRSIHSNPHGRLVRPHPLDLNGKRRVMGQDVFDPISKTWKEDDLRLRGYFEDPSTGKRNWACWGKCKTRTRRGTFGGTTTIKCKCNKGQDRCRCDGCMGNDVC